MTWFNPWNEIFPVNCCQLVQQNNQGERFFSREDTVPGKLLKREQSTLDSCYNTLSGKSNQQDPFPLELWQSVKATQSSVTLFPHLTTTCLRRSIRWKCIFTSGGSCLKWQTNGREKCQLLTWRLGNTFKQYIKPQKGYCTCDLVSIVLLPKEETKKRLGLQKLWETKKLNLWNFCQKSVVTD